MDTLQLLNPYTGKAQLLTIQNGLPTGESPSSILLEGPTKFLLGTKTRSAPAAGNVYRVFHVSGTTWRLVKLNTTPL